MLNLPEFIESYPQQYKQFKVNDLLFVEYHCPIEEMKAGFYTPSNYFMYVLSGKKKWQSQSQEYTAKANDAVFIRKGAYFVHQYFEEPFCTLLIFVPDEFIKRVIRKHQLEYPHKLPDFKIDSVISLHVSDVLATYFRSVLSYFPKSSPPPRSLLEVKFEELIINVLSDPKNDQLSRHFRDIVSRQKISIREIMEANFTFNMNLEEFARLCGRSLSTFHRDFKEIYNTTPGKWLIKRRLEHSRYLLGSDERNISDIALDCGFKSSSHFIRAFKKQFGVTPHRFQKQHLPI